ncbi:MAG: YraN family protein [Candidatus Omnitrophica bacterium]|nr:YraN family protein [Candidatus Omnitrophota bacterium]
MNRTALGRRCEEIAAGCLRRQGYRIIERNVRMRFGELDVVARDGSVLCFVEVRARSSTRFGMPEESVTPLKRRRLVRLAQGYLQRPSARLRAGLRGPSGPVRFDVLSLLLGPDGTPVQIRLIKNAFDAV